jgi:hypothetical protein
MSLRGLVHSLHRHRPTGECAINGRPYSGLFSRGVYFADFADFAERAQFVKNHEY